ncbi:F-box domain containing protein [Tanacetum coccineum]
MMAVLWNPTIRKSCCIYPMDFSFVGFGVCPNNSDPKLVNINTFGFRMVDWEVEVFKLSTCVWKTVSSIPLAFRSCDLTWEGQVCVGGFVYWLAYDNVKLGDGVRSNLIISFDLKSDEFGEVCLPDRLVHTYDLRVTKVKDSLGLLEDYDDGEIPFCGVWILNDGVTKSFAKMFSVKLQSEWIGPIAILDFTKDGKAIRLKYVDDDYMLSCVLSAYEENGKGVGIPVRVTLFAAKSYMETILLLDQSNSFVY